MRRHTSDVNAENPRFHSANHIGIEEGELIRDEFEIDCLFVASPERHAFESLQLYHGGADGGDHIGQIYLHNLIAVVLAGVFYINRDLDKSRIVSLRMNLKIGILELRIAQAIAEAELRRKRHVVVVIATAR